ncbi:MAG TPA: hypothetical protein GX717_02495, partial [Clostridiaceae bacterium]|nr:hypothetical protein [Clostridiaceae bacterium]
MKTSPHIKFKGCQNPNLRLHIILLVIGTVGYVLLTLVIAPFFVSSKAARLVSTSLVHLVGMIPLAACIYRSETTLCQGHWQQQDRTRLILRWLCSLSGGLFIIYFAVRLPEISIQLLFAVLGLLLLGGNVLMSVLSHAFMLYLVLGVLTTVVSIGSFSIANGWIEDLGLFDQSRTLSWFVPQTISFVLAALFAFLTNRRWVFRSSGPFWTELLSFMSSRIVSSLVIEYGGMFVLVNLLHMLNDVAKIVTSFTVVIVNYYISKLLVFNREKPTDLTPLKDGIANEKSRFGPVRLKELLGQFGHPEERTPVIHLAGTNGKGSVAAMLAVMLSGAGWRVGLYTSPHIKTYSERLRILDGHDLSQDNANALPIPRSRPGDEWLCLNKTGDVSEYW